MTWRIPGWEESELHHLRDVTYWKARRILREAFLGTDDEYREEALNSISVRDTFLAIRSKDAWIAARGALQS